MQEAYRTWEVGNFELVATVEVDPYTTPDDLEDPAAFDSADDYREFVEGFGTDWVYLNMRVTANFMLSDGETVELGDSTLGGITAYLDNRDDRHLSELTEEVGEDALHEAERHLQKIVESTATERSK